MNATSPFPEENCIPTLSGDDVVGSYRFDVVVGFWLIFIISDSFIDDDGDVDGRRTVVGSDDIASKLVDELFIIVGDVVGIMPGISEGGCNYTAALKANAAARLEMTRGAQKSEWVDLER